jgi:hypothetical protein
MSEQYVQLPTDAANTGKKIRVWERVVGANTVEEHFNHITDGTNDAGVTSGNALKVDASATTQPVSGTFWQTTQPISGTITANAGSGVFSVSGTVTSNIGTTNGLALDASLTGRFPSSAALVDATSNPTLTGIQSFLMGYNGTTWDRLQVDGSKFLKVNVAASSTIPVSGTFFQATQPVSIAAHVTVDQGAAGATAWKVDGSGVTQPVSGTFWQATQPVSGTITANAGTNLNTSLLALDTSVNGILLSQGSTTSGQKGALIQGAVTTASPSYTTAQTSPLSLTLAGALRTDASATTQPISGSVSVSNFPATQPVSGTVTANQGGAPWSQNLTQFGGVALSTGTGASGTGIPRVTISNDSSLAANQSVNINQLGGSAVTLGSKVSASSIPVVIASDQGVFAVSQSGTWTVQPGNTANTTAWLVTDSADGPVAAGAAATKSTLMGAVFNTSLPTMANSQQAATQMDVNGRMLVSVGSLDATVAATALGALNATVALAGVADVGYAMVITAISAPTGIVLTPEISCDGGTSWSATFFYDPTTQNIYATLDNTRPKAFAAGQQYKILCGSGVSNVRVRASAWTSGSVTVAIRSNDMEPLVAVVRNQTSCTYTAVYQLAAATSVALSASIAATVKQYATIYHPATALKQVRIKRITVNVESASVATKLAVQLSYLTSTTAPATGNPAITPTAHRSSSPVAEATCLALPTTAGSTGASGVGLVYSTEINMGVTVATTSPPISGDISVYDDTQGTNLEPLIMRAGVAEGWTVQLASSATSTVLATCKITFVEE